VHGHLVRGATDFSCGRRWIYGSTQQIHGTWWNIDETLSRIGKTIGHHAKLSG
jgi:hypothetical protein